MLTMKFWDKYGDGGEVYNHGTFSAEVDQSHVTAVLQVKEKIPILSVEKKGRKLLLWSCGCRAEEIRRELRSLGVEFKEEKHGSETTARREDESGGAEEGR